MAAKDAAELATEREQFSPAGWVVSVRGQIDLYSAPILQRALREPLTEGASELVVDLSGVDYIDSIGLGVLVAVKKRLRERDGAIAIVAPDELVRHVFEVAGLDQVLPLFETRASACEHVLRAD